MNWMGRPALAYMASKEEDRFTVFLAQLLLYPPFFEHFCSQLLETKPPPGLLPADTITTQRIIDGGRPDVSIAWTGFTCLIEAKLSSYLHFDQLVPYGRELERLVITTPATVTRLVILAPRSSLNGEMETGRHQLVGAGIKIEPLGISWEQIATALRELLGHASLHDESFRHHAAAFCDWIDLALGAEVRPLSTSEIHALGDRGVGLGVELAYRLTDKIAEAITGGESGGSLELKFEQSKKGDYSLYYGYRIVRRGVRIGWFGVWIGPWVANGVSPLWYEYDDSQMTPPDVEALEYRIAGDRSPNLNRVVPLKLLPAETEPSAVFRLRDQVIRLGNGSAEGVEKC